MSWILHNFYHERLLNLVRAFSVSTESIMLFLSSLMVYFIYWFEYVEPALYLWIKLIMIYTLFFSIHGCIYFVWGEYMWKSEQFVGVSLLLTYRFQYWTWAVKFCLQAPLSVEPFTWHMYDLITMFFNSVRRYFMENSCYNNHQRTWGILFFFVVCLPCFDFVEWVWQYSFSF